MKIAPLSAFSQSNLSQRICLVTATGLLLATSLSIRTIAQPAEPQPASNLETTDVSAADLVIPAWGSLEHDSSGGGFDGVTGLDGFIPLQQSPGRSITFLAPRFSLDNNAHLGGSLLLGHRFYSAESDRIYGGYLGADLRETDESTFTQLGFGLESLGEQWDFRFNAYLPIGDSRNLLAESRTDTGVVTSTQFQRNQLLLSSRQEERVTQVYEAALFGLDAEVGVKLADWNTGDLRAFGGLYYYDAEGTDGTLGWRARLEARPVHNVTLGVGLQDDALFGTNLLASVRLILPGSRPRGPITEATDVVARLGEPIGRTPTIAVDTQVETETNVQETTEPLRNPEEEQPYRFLHVTLGSRGGDGTAERPFGTVQQALNAAVRDGNTIIYVDAGNNATIPAFTIPDRVRVLSQAPVQLLAGQRFPGFPQAPARLPFSPSENFREGILVRLPFSGDGRFPTIEDSRDNLVTMGDRTVFSGFRLQNAANNAVIADGVEDVEIRDNTITNPGQRGIFLSNVSGSVVVFDNTITNAQGGAGSGQGILIRNSADNSVDVSIQRQQISDSRIGLEVAAVGNAGQGINPQQIVDIDAATIRNSDEQGMLLTADQLGNQQVTLRNSTIQASGAEGILARVTNSGAQELTVEDSTISSSRGDGVRAQSGILNSGTTAAQEVFLRRTRIEGNGGNGVFIEASGVAAQEFAIDRSTIINNGGDGIRGISSNVSFQEYVTDTQTLSSGISNNTITNNQGQGIRLSTNDSSTLIVDLQGNTVSGNSTAPDIEVSANANTNDVCTVLVNNTTGSGIRLNNNPTGLAALFQVGDISSLSVRNTGSVTLFPASATFTDRPGITSCFRN